MSLGQTDWYGLDACAEWVLGGISGRLTAQGCRNQGCSLMRTEMPMLKVDICFLVYTINTSAIRDPGNMHNHGSARAEIVHPDIFWGKSKAG